MYVTLCSLEEKWDKNGQILKAREEEEEEKGGGEIINVVPQTTDSLAAASCIRAFYSHVFLYFIDS